MEIKNLKKAAQRIQEAIEKRENILICGDSDLDGVAAVVILEETIRSSGGRVKAIYFPNREKEGYGITETSLRHFKKHLPALLISVDFGISNFKEIKIAKEMGFEVIVIDHHQILDELPEADIIVDPKQKEDKYPFKEFSAAGLVFKLSEIVLGDHASARLKKSLLEMAALSTVADMMPRESENRLIIEQGLFALEKTSRPGIKAFFESNEFKSYVNQNEIISKMISILNVRDVKYNLPASFRLLTCPSLTESKKLVKKLLKKNDLRKKKIEKTVIEIEKLMVLKNEPLIFEGERRFDSFVLSSVASILTHRHLKPVFLYKKMAKESQGTIRSPAGIDTVDLMKKCKKHLLTFGGHAQASGFRAKNQNLDKFKNCLIKELKQ